MELTAKETAAALAKVRATVEKEYDDALAKRLTPQQIVRLHQFVIQLLSVEAFSTPEVVEALKLTDKQKERVQIIQEKWDIDLAMLRLKVRTGPADRALEIQEKEFREKKEPSRQQSLQNSWGCWTTARRLDGKS